MSADSSYVLLAGDFAVPAAPVVLLCELEARGLTVAQDGDELVIRPRRLLSEEDCERIRRWKSHLLALVAYTPDPLNHADATNELFTKGCSAAILPIGPTIRQKNCARMPHRPRSRAEPASAIPPFARARWSRGLV